MRSDYPIAFRISPANNACYTPVSMWPMMIATKTGDVKEFTRGEGWAQRLYEYETKKNVVSFDVI